MLEQENYLEALEVLGMAEESFSLCDRKFLEAVDNVALLQIDTVWCLFMLRDIERLAVARERLARARDGLKRSHGPNLERLRVLQGGFCPELALYVRLELLEGVVAYTAANWTQPRLPCCLRSRSLKSCKSPMRPWQLLLKWVSP